MGPYSACIYGVKCEQSGECGTVALVVVGFKLLSVTRGVDYCKVCSLFWVGWGEGMEVQRDKMGRLKAEMHKQF